MTMGRQRLLPRAAAVLSALVVASVFTVGTAPRAGAAINSLSATCTGSSPGGAALRKTVDRCLVVTRVTLGTGYFAEVDLSSGAAPPDEGTVGCDSYSASAYSAAASANSGGPYGVGYGCNITINSGTAPAGAIIGRLDIAIPADAPIGQHIELQGGVCRSASNGYHDCDPPAPPPAPGQQLFVYPGGPLSVSGPGAVVVASAPTPTPPAAPSAAPSGAPPGQQPPSLGNPRLSTISASLPTPLATLSNGARLAISALVTLIVIVFITFPAHLFNRTLEENEDEIRAIMRRRAPWLTRGAGARVGSHQRRDTVAFAAVLLLGAVLGGFLDPGFGLTASSLPEWIALVLTFATGVATVALVGALYRRVRHHAVSLRLHAIPAGLCVAVVCVVISRVSGFTPGYLYGVVCGVVFAGTLSRREEGHVTALEALCTLLVAVAGWLVWVPLHGVAAHSNAGFGLVLLVDFLGSLFVAGLVGSAITLVPLRFLPGWSLAQWHRGVWAAVFAVAVFLVVVVLLQPVSSAAHTGRAALATAITLFVLFGGASLAFRWYFTRRRLRRAATAT